MHFHSKRICFTRELVVLRVWPVKAVWLSSKSVASKIMTHVILEQLEVELSWSCYYSCWRFNRSPSCGWDEPKLKAASGKSRHGTPTCQAMILAVLPFSWNSDYTLTFSWNIGYTRALSFLINCFPSCFPSKADPALRKLFCNRGHLYIQLKYKRPFAAFSILSLSTEVNVRHL